MRMNFTHNQIDTKTKQKSKLHSCKNNSKLALPFADKTICHVQAKA